MMDHLSASSSPNHPTSSNAGHPLPHRGRKGHRKSRAGCFNCKRARIKCKENRPSCDYCSHRNLRCEWPCLKPGSHLAHEPHQYSHAEEMEIVQQTNTPALIFHQATTTPVPVKLGGLDGHRGGLSFTAQDFRLFNFFVSSAYPHHPVNNDSTWTHDIPAIAHQFPFLLHAMLALSASELSNSSSAPSSTELRVVAMSHRLKSIEDLRRAVNKGLTSFEEANAMIATCFSLLFQSALINDGLSEYMSFIRGTVAIGIQMYIHGFHPLFINLYGDDAVQAIDGELRKTPLMDAKVVTAAIRSLETLSPICKSQVETEMLGLLLSMARNLITSSRDAYMELRKIYAHFSYSMPYDQFREFTNPENEVCQILQAYFVALQLVMTPISEVEYISPVKREILRREREGGHGKEGHWLVCIHERMRGRRERCASGGGRYGWEGYYGWTLGVEEEVYGRGRGVGGVYGDVGEGEGRGD